MNVAFDVRPLHERRWRPGDQVPPHMSEFPAWTPNDVRVDDARRLWAAVMEVAWADAHAVTSSSGEAIRNRAMQTANQRRAFVEFAENPFRPSDLAWMVSVLGINPHALASTVRRKVREAWGPLRRSDRWVPHLVTPAGELTEVFRALPAALSNADQFDQWLLLDRPSITWGAMPALLQSRTRAEFDQAVASLSLRAASDG